METLVFADANHGLVILLRKIMEKVPSALFYMEQAKLFWSLETVGKMEMLLYIKMGLNLKLLGDILMPK